jgi:hypothetical protein
MQRIIVEINNITSSPGSTVAHPLPTGRLRRPSHMKKTDAADAESDGGGGGVGGDFSGRLGRDKVR